MEMASTKVGCRFICNGHFGTVRYEGNLEDTEGVWLGVEWDDSIRGKHDGMHKGIRYFQASHATSGSFIRPNKADFGVTYLDAVIEKYRHENKEQEPVTFISSKPIEVIGMSKVSEMQSLHKLKTITLSDMRIHGSDTNENLEDFTPNVIDLDLPRNLLTSWKDVAFIVKHMNKLTNLDVSQNRLKINELPSQLVDAFKSIRELKMVKMQYKWDQITRCVQMMPNLQRLIVSSNSVSCLHDLDRLCFQQLEELNLSMNHIGCWDEVMKLATFPKLTTLDLSDCGLERIHFPNTGFMEKSNLFPSLQILRLSNNNYKNWQDISELDKLQHLVELRMSNNPICDSDRPQTVRQLFIARIGQLQMLNRVPIASDERRGAELDYLKKYGQAWLDATTANSEARQADFLKEHSRYEFLVKKHGAVEPCELKHQSTNIKSKTLSLNISSPNSDSTFNKKIPYTMTVQKLKHVLKQLYKTGNEDLTVSYISSKHGSEIILDNDLRTLSFFSIEDGDKIIVAW